MQHAIRFETFSPPQPPDPVRMDVTCFVGFAAQRADAAVPPALAAGLAQSFGQQPAAFDLPGGLYNRPVPVTSVAEFEALFDDARLERSVVVEGGPLARPLPGSGVADFLGLVIDGIIHQVPLAPLPTTAEEVVDRIDAAGLGLDVSAPLGPAGPVLRLAFPDRRGSGTLAVLPYPTLGFPLARRASARSIPSAMGMAVRQFFASGGQKAIIVSMGPAPIYGGPRGSRLAALRRLFTGDEGPTGAGDVLTALGQPAPGPTVEPENRHGVTQLYGLSDATFLALPDLPELCAAPAELAAVQPEPVAPVEAFADCLSPETGASDAAQSAYQAPELDGIGHALWQGALRHVLGILASHARDTMLLAALPRAARLLSRIDPPRSAFLQLAEGWVRTNASAAAPEGLMPPDGVLAGHLAQRALTGGTFLSAAALQVAPLHDIEQRGRSTSVPTCGFVADLHGIRLAGDLTTSEDPNWVDGPVSRIMALLHRQGQLLGQEIVFEPNGQQLWSRVRSVFEGLLTVMWRVGALAGATPADAFEVRCDHSTMSQQDIDTGVLVAEVTFTPTVPVQRITVRLPLTERPAARMRPSGGPA